MSRIVIVGTGLLGSSLGLAVKRAGLYERVVGVSSPAVVEEALRVGAVDEALPLGEAVRGAALVVLAQPVRRIVALLGELDGMVDVGTLVTDVGSTKGEICAAAAGWTRGRFVGGHPMAGREVRGPAGATAELFVGRPWVLTEAAPELLRLVEGVGARAVVLPAAEHDAMVAMSSHLPQLLATALGSYLHGRDLRAVAGPGLLDMTRLAMSSHELWADILATNAGNVDAALAGMIGELEKVRAGLREGQLEEAFARGAEFARGLREGR